MSISNISSNDVIFALDIGTRSIIGTVGIVKDKKFQVIGESYIEHEERAMLDGQIHDINLVSIGVDRVKRQLESEIGFKLKNVAIAAAGRFLRTTTAKAEIKLDYERDIDKDTIRSLELSAVKNAENEISGSKDSKLYCVGYSVKSYFLNDYVITNLLSHKGDKAAVEVIATFLPRSVVESLYVVMDKVGLNVVNLTLEPIAAMEAAIPKSLRLLNLALVDIGAGTSDIAISSKDTISAYGMVSNAGDEVTEAIAQNFLVDFNTAERIKKDCTSKEIITYTDVLGFENEVSSEEVIKVILPVVNKLCEDIASKVIDLNGGKAPNAVFLVGGGAHTPKLKEILARRLNLPDQRIGIKGRESVADCICEDNSLGSIGVTVLGIALISIMKLGQDFIDINLNGNIISMFNSHKHTVSDVLVQAGINPKVLIGRNGKNIKFTLNGVKKIAFGSLGKNAKISINGCSANIDSEVKEGDIVEVIYAVDGEDAAPKIFQHIGNLSSISFYIDDIITVMEPLIYINNVKGNIDDKINENDDITAIMPKTLGQYRKFIENGDKSITYYKDSLELNDDYIIDEGHRIYKKVELKIENEIPENNNGVLVENTDLHNKAEDNKERKAQYNESLNTFYVIVNGEKVYLKNKKQYIFIDIFDFIEFDLTRAKGNLILELNNEKAGYYDELKQGDKVIIHWE